VLRGKGMHHRVKLYSGRFGYLGSGSFPSQLPGDRFPENQHSRPETRDDQKGHADGCGRLFLNRKLSSTI